MAREEVSFVNKFNDKMYGYAWTIEKPKGNIVIVTGMEEYALRYDDFANFLNKNGYDVYCFDHYGQGLNAESIEKQGIVPTSFFSKSVKNIDEIVTRCRVSCLPTTIIAHSMGSFMLQDYIQRFTEHINKVVFVGTNGPNAKFSYSFGKFVARICLTKRNRDKKFYMMNNLLFKGYEKHFDDVYESNWISLDKNNVDAYIKDEQTGYVSTHGFYYEFMKGLNRIYKKKFLNKIRKDMNILIVSGDDDPVGAHGKGPTKLANLYRKLGLENVELHLYSDLRHELLNEANKDEIYNDILDFINRDTHKAESFLK